MKMFRYTKHTTYNIDDTVVFETTVETGGKKELTGTIVDIDLGDFGETPTYIIEVGDGIYTSTASDIEKKL